MTFAEDVLRIDQRLLSIFVMEARKHIAAMRRGVRVLCQGDAERTEEIWRGAHTIAGSAAMLDLQDFVDVARAIERLGGTHSSEIAVAAAAWIADAIDEIERLVESVEVAASRSRTLTLNRIDAAVSRRACQS